MSSVGVRVLLLSTPMMVMVGRMMSDVGSVIRQVNQHQPRGGKNGGKRYEKRRYGGKRYGEKKIWQEKDTAWPARTDMA